MSSGWSRFWAGAADRTEAVTKSVGGALTSAGNAVRDAHLSGTSASHEGKFGALITRTATKAVGGVLHVGVVMPLRFVGGLFTGVGEAIGFKGFGSAKKSSELGKFFSKHWGKMAAGGAVLVGASMLMGGQDKERYDTAYNDTINQLNTMNAASPQIMAGAGNAQQLGTLQQMQMQRG